MQNPRNITITVFGSSRPAAGSAAYELACQLGRAIGRQGWTLCNGGYGGTMAASAKGAKDAGGRTIGVTCSLWGRSGIHPYIDREVCTDNLYGRLQALLDLGHGYVALPGGTGTLLEMALVWELANKKFLKDRPLVLLGECWRGVMDSVAADDPRSLRVVRLASDVAEAVELLAEGLIEAGR